MSNRDARARRVLGALASAAASAVLLISLGTAPAQAVAVKIGGTGAALGGIRLLAEAFHRQQAEVTVEVVEGLGSTGGIRALIAGAVDIGLAGRSLRDGEREAGAMPRPYARTPFVIVTHPEVPVEEISMQDAVGIYAGRVTAWPDGTPLRLIMRPEGDSDTAMLMSISEELAESVTQAQKRQGLTVATTDQKALDHVERLPGAVGTSTLALVSTEHRKVKVMALAGMVPSVESLRDGRWPYYKDLAVVTLDQPSEPARAFLDFMWSPEGRAVLEASGHLWIGGAAGT